MKPSRNHVLTRIRDALGRGHLGVEHAARLEQGLRAHNPRVLPRRARPEPGARIDAFRAEAERVNATVSVVSGAQGLPAAIKSFLEENNLPLFVKASPDLERLNIPWAEQSGLDLAFGPAGDDDPVALTLAFAGVCETGTLVLLSGSEAPAAMNFLPETHLAVLFTDRLVGAYEDAWAMLREAPELGGLIGQFMPRMACWITGPSRTADIEQKLLLGAHGPRRLHILIVDR